MPRASDYLLAGYTYHLTHRCHNRSFLLRFARDRETYRGWLREGVKRFKVPVYGYSVTCNHAHVIVHADNTESVSALMHLVAGSTAKQFNVRKDHLGSMWEHPYQCTVIESGRHLLNCLCYVDMNMVRAGAVRHPEQWRWCGYDELIGKRKRNRIIDADRLLDSLGLDNMNAFRELYLEKLQNRLSKGSVAREPHWTESLAVGSKSFLENVCDRYSRRRLDYDVVNDVELETWAVRETPQSYNPGVSDGPRR